MAKLADGASVHAPQRPFQDRIQWRRYRMKRPPCTPATASRHDPMAKEGVKRPFGRASDLSRQDTMAKVADEASARTRQRPSRINSCCC